MKRKHLQPRILQSKILPYIRKRFGSVSVFKVLKYITEFTVARRSGGFAVYEVAFGIPPSEIMTRTAFISIVVKADKVTRDTVEKAITELIERKILRYDRQTDIIKLAVDVKDFTDIYLKLQKDRMIVTQDHGEADVILLPVAIRDQSCGVPDILVKNPKDKTFQIVEIKGYD